VVPAAVLAGPALGGGRERESSRSRFGLGLATLALGWAVVVAAAIVLVTEVKLGDSRQAARQGDYEAAADDAAAARAVQPWAAAPRLQLALVRERLGDLSGAGRAAREAAERDGDDWRVWLIVARIAVRSGDVPEARRAARRARSLNPRSPLFANTSP
jgi:Flp pilus assembly protein TadD